MAPQTPMLLVDNLCDRVTLYPSAVVTASSEVSGREVRRLSDYRRERTWWQPTDDGVANSPQGNWIDIDLGSGNAGGVDYLWLDRGSPNIWNRTITIQMSDDHVTWPASKNLAIPDSAVLGGDPSSGTATITEDGEAYAIFAPLAPRRYIRVFFPYASGFIPVVTGLMLGMRNQFFGYSSTYNDDDGERTQNATTSDAGYRASARTYAWATATLTMKLIGDPEYDTVIREIKRKMFNLNQPAALVMNWGDYPERSLLHQLDGTKWAAPKTRTMRDLTIPLRECGHSIAGG